MPDTGEPARQQARRLLRSRGNAVPRAVIDRNAAILWGHELGLSTREIAAEVGISHTAVGNIIRRAERMMPADPQAAQALPLTA